MHDAVIRKHPDRTVPEAPEADLAMAVFPDDDLPRSAAAAVASPPWTLRHRGPFLTASGTSTTTGEIALQTRAPRVLEPDLHAARVQRRVIRPDAALEVSC